MIGYVMVGTNNLDKAIIFYDEVLQILNLQRKDTDEICAGYCQKGGDGSIEFYVTKPANKKTATFGNGTQVSFIVSSIFSPPCKSAFGLRFPCKTIFFCLAISNSSPGNFSSSEIISHSTFSMN